MAKKNAATRNGSSNGNSSEEWAVPEGFNINVGRDRGDGWAKKQEGNVIQGRLLGRYTYENRGKKRAYYQIKLDKPCIAEVDNPEYDEENPDDEIPERVTAKLEAGAVVNVDESAKLADLESRSGDGGVYNVWFVYGKKVDLDKGRTMWNIIGPRLQMVQKPEEIPF